MTITTCSKCGVPAHASESNDRDECIACITDAKLEEAWLCVTTFADGSDEQIALAHDFACHRHELCPHDTYCAAVVDREAIAMLDLARYVRNDREEAGTMSAEDETEFRRRWYASRPS